MLARKRKKSSYSSSAPDRNGLPGLRSTAEPSHHSVPSNRLPPAPRFPSAKPFNSPANGASSRVTDSLSAKRSPSPEPSNPPDSSAVGRVHNTPNESPSNPQKAPPTKLDRLLHELTKSLLPNHPRLDPLHDRPGCAPQPARTSSAISAPLASYDPSVELCPPEPSAKRPRLNAPDDITVLSPETMQSSPSTNGPLALQSHSAESLNLHESTIARSRVDVPNMPLGHPPGPASTSSTMAARFASPSTTPWDDLTMTEQEQVRTVCQEIVNRQRLIDPKMRDLLTRNGHPFFRALRLNYTRDADDAWTIVSDNADMMPLVQAFRNEITYSKMQCTLAVAERYYQLINHGTAPQHFYKSHCLCTNFVIQKRGGIALSSLMHQLIVCSLCYYGQGQGTNPVLSDHS